MYPTRTVVFGSEVGGVPGQVSGFVGSGQLQGLGAAMADVAKVAREAAKRVKNCMMVRMGLTVLGEARWLGRVMSSGVDVCRMSGWMGSYRRNRKPFIPPWTRTKALNLGLQDPRAV